jgi:putative ABC transport system permease protein
MILKFTLRNLAKRPFLNSTKVIGLSLALTALIIISLYLKMQLTYDQFHSQSDRIYRFTVTSENFFGGKHFARMFNASFIPAMADYFPEIETYTRLARVRDGFIQKDETFFEVDQAFQVDSTFLNIFEAELLVGDQENILNEPGVMVISEEYAQKIFGQDNPIGQTLTLPAGQFNAENIDFTVKGVMKDFPSKSHLHPDFIITPRDKSVFNSWAWVYLLLTETADQKKITEKFLDFGSEVWEMEKSEINLIPHIQNIRDIHLHSNKLREIEPNGNMVIIYTLSAAMFLLLFIALINYANLNIGMAGFSDKFVFINKLSGSSQKITIKHYLMEGFIVVLMVLFISYFLTIFANSLIQKNLAIDLFTGEKVTILLIVLIFAALCMIASVAPMYKLMLRRVNTALDTKEISSVKRKGISKGLIVLQYTISIALIVAVIIIYQQTSMALQSGMGGNTDHLICFENVHANVQGDFPIFKEELRKYNSIEMVSAMFEPPGGEANDMFPFEMEGYIPDESDPQSSMIGVFPCDYSFASIFDLTFLGGKNFSEKYEDSEGSGEYIINEAAMKRLGYTKPDNIVGKSFNLNFFNDNIQIPKGNISGVVKDFHFSSLKKQIEPYVFFKRDTMWISNFIVSFKAENKAKAIADIESVWNKLFPNYPFEYTDIDSMYKNVYRAELLQAKLLSIFTIIALVIGSMGLLGMSLLITQKRTKEIGIRKVNGAKLFQIVWLINWSLLKWIIVSFIISVPLAYFAMQKWLENFAYKVELSWWIFGIAGLVAIVISILTISAISWNAARKNPVEALRYE